MTDFYLCLFAALMGGLVGLELGARGAVDVHSKIDPVDPNHWTVQWYICKSCKRRVLLYGATLAILFYFICQFGIDNYNFYFSSGGQMSDSLYFAGASLYLAVIVTAVVSYLDHNRKSPHRLTCVNSGRNWYKCKENPLVLLIFFVIIRILFWFAEP